MSRDKIAEIQFITHDIPGLSHARQARQACEGGIRWVQLRLKNRTYDEWLTVAVEVQQVCREYDATFIINDNVQLAKTLSADGVHLGRTDMPVTEARDILGVAAIIGGTANTEQELRQRFSEPLDYVGFGPYRFTKTKEALAEVLGLDTMSALVQKIEKESGTQIPVIAIGGITLDDVNDIYNAGFHGIALSSAIGQAKDPLAAARQFSTRFAAAKGTK